MKNRILAIALLIVMMFTLAACGSKDEAPAVETEAPAAETEAPAVETEAPAAETEAPVVETPAPEPTELPVEDVITANGGVEPNSGVYKVTSSVNGISFNYDSKYVESENSVGNFVIYADPSTPSIPYCTVSLIEDTTAVDYLKEMAAAAKEEQGDSLQTQPGEPVAGEVNGRSVSSISYSFKAKDSAGVVVNTYYAEDLGNGSIVVFASSALEGATEDVEAILKLAMETFSLAV